MKKNTKIFLFILGAILVLWLVNSDLTTGTKTAIFVGVFLYFVISEQNKRFITSQGKIHKTPSYKLDITLQPDWYKLYKRVSKPKSEKEWEKELEKKIKKSDESDLWQRSYHFTEYYDSVSGLTTRFQRIFLKNGKQLSSPVNEFGDFGYVFESDRDLESNRKDKEGNSESMHGKLAFEITEDSIRNNVFDKHIGGRSIPEKEDYLFTFPLYEVFNFLFTLGQRFHGTEDKPIIKWPDQIEKKFKELGIKYEIYFDYKPIQFDIEKHDKEIYEKLGKPKIALYGDDEGYLTADEASYWVKLKIFRPGENDRVPAKN